MQAKSVPSAKELHKTLESENPTWKLPDRRVSKFLKRELKAQGKNAATVAGTKGGDDDDDVSVTSTASRAKEMAKVTGEKIKKLKSGSFLGGLSFRKKKREKQATAASSPPLEISTHKIREEQAPKKEEVPVSPLPEPEEPVVVEEKEAESKGLYLDDNNGSKEDQLCAEQCIIL